jgi:hypothetical protein
MSNTPNFPELESRYRQLKEEFEHVSSPRANSGIYLKELQEIVDLGEGVIPLILQDIQIKASFIVNALPRITSERPARESEPGDIQDKVDSWLEWGILKGYLKI